MAKQAYLLHSAKNSTWDKHKYSERVKTPGGWGYIYNNGSHNTASKKRGQPDNLSDKGYNSSTGSKTKQETGSTYGQGGILKELAKETGETANDFVNAIMQNTVVPNANMYDEKKFEGVRQDLFDALKYANDAIKYQGNGIWMFVTKESGQPKYASEGPALERLLTMAVEEYMRFHGHSDLLPGFNDYINRNGKTAHEAYAETANINKAKGQLKVFTNENGQAIRSTVKPHTGQLANIYGRMKNTSSRKNTDKMLRSMDPNSADYNALKNMMNNSSAVRKKKKVEHNGMYDDPYIIHSAKDTTWTKKNPKYEKRVGTPPNAYYIYNNGSHSTGPRMKNFKTSGSDVSDAWKGAANATGTYVKESAEEVGNAIGNAVRATGQYVKETAVETKEQAQAYVNRKANETKTAINRKANEAKQNMDRLQARSRAAATEAKRQIDSAANEANRRVTEVKNSAISTYVNTKAKAANAYGKAKEQTVNTYNNAVSSVQRYGQRAKESAINTRNSMQRSAKAAQQNFENSVNNMVKSAKNAYNSGVNNAKASIGRAKGYIATQKARVENSYNQAVNYASGEYNRILKEAERKIDAIQARANKIAGASSSLLGDIRSAGNKWKEEAFHDGMYNGAYVIHKVPENPELVLCHSRAGTTWEKLNHKYIAKIDGKYFYTPEELRAYKSGAIDKGKELLDKGKDLYEKGKEKAGEYWEKGKEKAEEGYSKGKEKVQEGYSKGKAAVTRSSRQSRYHASKMADDLASGRRVYEEDATPYRRATSISIRGNKVGTSSYDEHGNRYRKDGKYQYDDYTAKLKDFTSARKDAGRRREDSRQEAIVNNAMKYLERSNDNRTISYKLKNMSKEALDKYHPPGNAKNARNWEFNRMRELSTSTWHNGKNIKDRGYSSSKDRSAGRNAGNLDARRSKRTVEDIGPTYKKKNFSNPRKYMEDQRRKKRIRNMKQGY